MLLRTWLSFYDQKYLQVRQLPTQSTEKWICMEKWAVLNLASFIREVVVIVHLWSSTVFLMTAYLQTPK